MAIAACGSSSKPDPTASGAESPSLVNFAVCMRSHGVSHFPDPGSGPASDGPAGSGPASDGPAGSGPAAGGVSIVPSGIDTSAPAFRTAWSACSKLLPGLGTHQQPSAQGSEQMLTFSRCMRGHGVTDFPDPTATPPSPQAGYAAMFRRGGAYLAIPDSIDMASPVYRHAAAACRFGPKFS